MKPQPKFIIFDKTESVLHSLVKDLFTFGLLGLCIYISHGSRWWTFFMGLMALVFICAKLAVFTNKRQTKLHTKAEAIAWANGLDADGEQS